MNFEESIKRSEKIYEQIADLSAELSTLVEKDFMFTWQWWFGIALFIIPWVFWLIFRNKESQVRLLFAGAVVIIISITIDLVALTSGLWVYPLSITTIAPILFLPYHFSLTPVAVMFLLQIKPGINPIVKGALFAALAAFIGMPFFEMIDFYDSKGWSTFYDFLIFLGLFLVGYVCTRIKGFDELKKR